MKKSTIWLLVCIMALSFGSLLYLQLGYMDSMMRMRREQFSEAAKRSLYGVSRSLEQDETKRYLLEDIEDTQAQVLSLENGSSSGAETITEQLSVVSPNGMVSSYTVQHHAAPTLPKLNIGGIVPENNSVIKTYKGLQEVLKGKYLYQRGLLDEVVLNILSQSSSRPILDRLEIAKVKSYIRAELQNNGLNVPYEFAIVDSADKMIYSSADYAPGKGASVMTQVIFPNDPPNKLSYLKVYFPTQRDYVNSSIQFMWPSFGFTFILLITFIFTIVIAFRQKRLTEMKNDFINNMTHEFKTPISTISLAAQMLEDSSVGKNPQMFQHISGVIKDETKRLRFQVEKVLQMSMFERQKAMMKLVAIDGNDLVAGVLSTFKLKVEKYGGTIEADLAPEDAPIMVDEMHFTNVVFNLLDNAVKYSREGVPLALMVTTHITGNKFELAIQDNGVGIKKDDLKKIFDKFYRVSTGNVHNVKGFGLGLAYVYKIVKDLKGTIRAESDYGVGTKFIITLPLIKND